MTKKQLIELYNTKGVYKSDDIPPLKELYVIPLNKKHISGYKLMLIFGYNRNIDFCECLSDCSDVITFITKDNNYNRHSIDIYEKGMIHYFIHFSKSVYKVKNRYSDFDVEIEKEIK